MSYIEVMENLLAKYEERAKTMTAAELHYALLDVVKTLDILESDEATRNSLSTNPYLQKLYAEKDAYSVEIYRRRS